MKDVKEISFSGLYGSYIKNNIKHKFNLKQNNLALEVIGVNDTFKLNFYKNFSLPNEKIKTIDEIQDVFIDNISEDSGIILDAKKIFNIKNVIRGSEIGKYPFIDVGKIARVAIDKMRGGIIYIKNSKTNNNPRVAIDSAEKILVHNKQNNNQFMINYAKNMTLSDTDIDEKILLSAENADLTFEKKFDILT